MLCLSRLYGDFFSSLFRAFCGINPQTGSKAEKKRGLNAPVCTLLRKLLDIEYIFYIFILQKRAMRIIHRADYGTHTNDLFWKSKTLKLFDLVEHKTAQVLYKARNYLLPKNIQRMFHEREQSYDLREKSNLKVGRARTTMKSFCITICGVKLWNNLSTEIKNISNIILFKRRHKEMILQSYIE